MSSEDGRDHTWEARVVASSRGAATVYVRKHRFEVGPPVSFDRELPRVTALEHALGALASEVVVGLREAAARRRLEVGAIEAKVEGRLGNALVTLGVVGETGDPAIAFVKLRVFAQSPHDAEELDPAWREALERAPLYATLKKSATLEATFTVQ